MCIIYVYKHLLCIINYYYNLLYNFTYKNKLNRFFLLFYDNKILNSIKLIHNYINKI